MARLINVIAVLLGLLLLVSTVQAANLRLCKTLVGCKANHNCFRKCPSGSYLHREQLRKSGSLVCGFKSINPIRGQLYCGVKKAGKYYMSYVAVCSNAWAYSDKQKRYMCK